MTTAVVLTQLVYHELATDGVQLQAMKSPITNRRALLPVPRPGGHGGGCTAGVTDSKYEADEGLGNLKV